MLAWQAVFVIGVIAVAAFFFWTNRKAAKAHARFQSEDVERALAEVLSPDARWHDTFDQFLSWPIDDSYLESVRQRCLRIIRDTDPSPPGQDISDEGLKQIAVLLQELRNQDHKTSRPRGR